MIAPLIARVRSLWRGIRRSDDVDAEMNEEFRHHLELRAADLVRSGLSPAEAARLARIEFGGIYRYREEGRESRGLRHFDALRFSWLDVKLGARMVLKYPGLSIVGVIGMAIAIAIGAGLLTAIALVTSPKLPLDEGDRVIGIEVWNTANNNPQRRIVHDFELWRREVRTVDDLGAFRVSSRNVTTSEGRTEPTRVAEMSAAGFRVARVQPAVGRYLVEDDEKPGAPAVLVIGHDVWRNRFAGDSGVLGKTVQIGAVSHTIVGVMPKGFAFPLNEGMWIPLRVNALNHKPGEGPSISVFGRLAPGATLVDARAEIATLGQRASAAFPATHAQLRPRLLPYTQSWFELDNPDFILAFQATRFIIMLLLVVICGHVAILVYARTATRHSEIAIRTALGASRTRIVMQLFGESLALAALAGLVGIALLWFAFRQAEVWTLQVFPSGLPFWISLRVSADTITYVIGLALFGAVIVGVVPGLQATGRRIQLSLQRLSGGNASIRLGKAWTALIIAEVAFTVAILPAAVSWSAQSIRAAMAGPGFAASEFLTGMLVLERGAMGHELERDASMGTDSTYQRRFMTRYGELQTELFERLRAEPGVAGATFASGIPGAESQARFELDSVSTATMAGGGSEKDGTFWLWSAQVDVDFFDVFDVPVLAGRTFRRADADTTTRTAIVNRAFVESMSGSGSAVGRRIRRAAQCTSYSGAVCVDSTPVQAWHEIVGVVDNFPANPAPVLVPKIYTAVAPGQLYAATLFMRLPNRDPGTFSGRLRALAADIQPTLQMRFIQPLDDAHQTQLIPNKIIALALGVITLSVLLLSTAGIYALMSVVVTQRRREIGIRVALGAGRGQILASVFSRAAIQLTVGVVVGLGAALLLDRASDGSILAGTGKVILPAVSIFMMLVGLLAVLGPARRGFQIEPTEALKAE